jgi:hypothetical protein
MDTSDSCKSSLPGEISSAEQRVVNISSTGSPAQPAVTGQVKTMFLRRRIWYLVLERSEPLLTH